MLVRVNKQVAELLKGLDSSNLLGLLRKSHNVEVLVQIENLLQVLLLHLVPRGAELAVVSLLGVQQLVDDNVVGVNVKRGQVLDHSLCLVQRQELGNANTHKGGEVGVLELGVDLRDGGSGLVELCEHVVSRGTPWPPIREPSMGPNRPESSEILPRAFSRTVGKVRNRRVWPVGAVSKMMTE